MKMPISMEERLNTFHFSMKKPAFMEERLKTIPLSRNQPYFVDKLLKQQPEQPVSQHKIRCFIVQRCKITINGKETEI